jgi:hypothetical protein
VSLGFLHLRHHHRRRDDVIEVSLLRPERRQFRVRGPQRVGSGECEEVLAGAVGFLLCPLPADPGHDHLFGVVHGKLFELRGW